MRSVNHRRAVARGTTTWVRTPATPAPGSPRAMMTSPFTGWAPRALWLEPDVTVEVRYLAQGPGLRHAVLVPPAGPGRSPSWIP